MTTPSPSSLEKTAGKTLGLDLGGTKIAVAVVEVGEILAQYQVSTPQSGFDDVVTAMANAAKVLLDDHPDIAKIGVGSPGPLDYKAGKIIFAPNIPGMDGAPIVDRLRSALGRDIALENDANAAGYAEHLYGAAHDLETSIYVTISTGIGGGLFIGDKVVRGGNGIAGEVGHMTVLPGGPLGGDGHDGSLEALAAGRSIARDGSYSYGVPLTTKQVFERAQQGERKALKIIDNAARFTGIGLANMVKIFDPDGFVIGGGMSQVGAFYLDKIQAAFDEYMVGYPKVDIRTAKLGTDAGVIGAASVAAQEITAI